MHAEVALSREALAELWDALGRDDSIAEPYELNERGEVVMSPRPTNRHQALVGDAIVQITAQLGPRAAPETAVFTSVGIRVPDVVWMPRERWAAVLAGDGLVSAPELVVEVLSPGNRAAEIGLKLRGYLESGVREVAVVQLDGAIRWHRADGAHDTSALGVTLDFDPTLFG